MINVGERLLRIANWTVRIVGGAIFAWLTWHSLRYTYLCIPGGDWAEVPVVMRDVVWKQLIFVGLVAALWVVLVLYERKAGRNASQLVSGLSICAALVWIFALSVYWINSAVRVPYGDPAFVYGGASYFIGGDFTFLQVPGGYLALYPHQMPLIALTEILFRMAGEYNFYAYECCCVLFAAAIVFTGYLILREVTMSMAAAVMYSLTAVCCFPLVFYTSWVYGDVPSIFFAMLAAWMLLKYDRTKSGGALAGMVFSVTMAVLVRKNSMILIVALCLVAAVCLFAKRDRKLFLAAVCAAVLPFLIYQGVYKLYEVRSGYEHSQGIPVITWVSMGLDENNGAYGWYNDSGKRMYAEAGFDRRLTKAAARTHISERLKEFKDDKSYAMVFFREKILSQWNSPLYQSVFFNTQYLEGDEPAPESLAAKVSGEYFPKVLAICNRLQLIIYLGMLCYFVFAVKGSSNILQHLLAVVVIGGFFFSILWEAKSRYVFPYYVTMFPLAAMGYSSMFGTIAALGRPKEQEEAEDNIIPFKKSA